MKITGNVSFTPIYPEIIKANYLDDNIREYYGEKLKEYFLQGLKVYGRRNLFKDIKIDIAKNLNINITFGFNHDKLFDKIIRDFFYEVIVEYTEMEFKNDALESLYNFIKGNRRLDLKLPQIYLQNISTDLKNVTCDFEFNHVINDSKDLKMQLYKLFFSYISFLGKKLEK